MSELRASDQDDQQLVRYLLGSLPDEEAERLDEQTIVDDGMAARLRVVEDDLVDAYVSGGLSGETLARFESFYLLSPRRREKVAFARRLLTTVDRSVPQPAAAPPAEPAPFVCPAPPVQTRARARRPAWLVASLAAAAALVLSCGILVYQDAQLGRSLRDAQRQGVLADERARALSGQLEEQRRANAAVTQELARVRAAQPIGAIALVLLPLTRGVGPVPLVAVRPGSDVVPLDLQIEGADFPRYEVSLKDPATNRIVWRTPILTPGSSRHPVVVSVAVPVSLLKAQHYSLDLSGRRSGGAPEIVGSYAFQVVPQ